MAQAREHPAVNGAPSAGDLAGQRVWPVLCLVVGMLLVADALFLMTQRVFSLGVTLPFVLGLGLLAMGARWQRLQVWLRERPARRRAWRRGWLMFVAWLASLALFWTVLARAGGVAPGTTAAPRAIVVLGSGTPGGRVSPVLAARLDTALAQAARYPDAVVVTSGGIDFSETRSEGAIMGDYLRARGLPAARIVQEERSTSTEQNLLFTAPLLAARGIAPRAPLLIVTSDFHTLRAGWIARRAGYYAAVTVGAPTPLYVRYNAWLREYFAVASGFVLREFG